MSQVAVQKCNNPETSSQTLLEKMESVADSIRQRAFSLFEHRSGNGGSELDDWLQAERDVIFTPTSELADNEKEFVATIALPGFDAKDIHISAVPDALIVQAASSHTHRGKNDGVRFSEFSDKQVYRRLDWPEAVDVDKVTAAIDKGILEITAPKAAAGKSAAKMTAAA